MEWHTREEIQEEKDEEDRNIYASAVRLFTIQKQNKQVSELN